jgi:hypothetical protein
MQRLTASLTKPALLDNPTFVQRLTYEQIPPPENDGSSAPSNSLQTGVIARCAEATSFAWLPMRRMHKARLATGWGDRIWAAIGKVL